MVSRDGVRMDEAMRAVASARECLGNGLAAISRPDPDHRAACKWFFKAEVEAARAREAVEKGW